MKEIKPLVRSITPAAQAVMEAFEAASDGYYFNGEWIQDHAGQIAAALEALADQVAPSDAAEPRNYLPVALECQRIRREILAIAAELRGGDG